MVEKLKQYGLIILVMGLISINTAQAQISSYKGQALFIYNFMKHIKWQNNPSVYVIGVYGKSDINTELVNNLKGKLIESRPIEVKTINSPSEVNNCQIIYVSSSKSKELQALNPESVKSVLIITEEDLASKGAGISFLLVDDKLRFKINEGVLNKNGLQVSGGLLSLAYRS